MYSTEPTFSSWPRTINPKRSMRRYTFVFHRVFTQTAGASRPGLSTSHVGRAATRSDGTVLGGVKSLRVGRSHLRRPGRRGRRGRGAETEPKALACSDVGKSRGSRAQTRNGSVDPGAPEGDTQVALSKAQVEIRRPRRARWRPRATVTGAGHWNAVGRLWQSERQERPRGLAAGGALRVLLQAPCATR